MLSVDAHPNKKPAVGISACLMGEAVRYDGADKRHSLLNDILRSHVEFHAFCPEVAAGLGVPRPAVRLEKSMNQGIRAKGIIDRDIDVTEKLEEVSTNYLLEARKTKISGYIFQSRSPSCGLHSTPIYSPANASKNENIGLEVITMASGIFAGAICSQLNYLVCVEDTWLVDKDHCYLFLAAVTLTQSQQFGNDLNPMLLALILDQQPSKLTSPLKSDIEKALAMLLNGSSNNQKAALGRRLSDYFEN